MISHSRLQQLHKISSRSFLVMLYTLISSSSFRIEKPKNWEGSFKHMKLSWRNSRQDALSLSKSSEGNMYGSSYPMNSDDGAKWRARFFVREDIAKLIQLFRCSTSLFSNEDLTSSPSTPLPLCCRRTALTLSMNISVSCSSPRLHMMRPLKLSFGQPVHKHLHLFDKTLVRTTSSAGNFDKIPHSRSFSDRLKKYQFRNLCTLKIDWKDRFQQYIGKVLKLNSSPYFVSSGFPCWFNMGSSGTRQTVPHLSAEKNMASSSHFSWVTSWWHWTRVA